MRDQRFLIWFVRDMHGHLEFVQNTVNSDVFMSEGSGLRIDMFRYILPNCDWLR